MDDPHINAAVDSSCSLYLTEESNLSNAELIKLKIKKAVSKRLTLQQIFSRYVDISTLHGVKYACSKTYIIRRIFWSLLMVIGAIYFFDKLKIGIEEYITYPFSTRSTVDYVKNLTFPAISFCLVNSYNSLRAERSKLLPLYRDNALPLDKKWNDKSFDIPGEELADTLTNISITMEEIFVNCEWINRDTRDPQVEPNVCGIMNFTQYFNKHGQLCYTLNSGKEDHEKLSVTHSGLSYAYNLLFDLRVNESVQSFTYGGMKVILHEQNQPPMMSDGFMLSPGFNTYVKMSKSKKKHLPPPYSTKCGHKRMNHHHGYSQKACLLEMLTEEAGRKCGCRALFMPDKGLPFCSLNETIGCIFPVEESFNDNEKREECPIECEEVSYDVQLTSGRYIPILQHSFEEVFNDFEPINKSKQERRRFDELTENLHPKDLDRYIKNNLVNVYFFYGEMTRETHEQEGTLDFYQFLGDMGGEIGLMMGASILTFFEIIDLLFFLLYNMLLSLHKYDDEGYEEFQLKRKENACASDEGEDETTPL